MARFADEAIERIKAEVSLVRLVEQQGYALVKQGKDLALCCPFHEDKTPSCVITPAKNLFHCFGCGASGSVIDWVMKTQRISFRHAVELLNTDVSLAVSQGLVEAPLLKRRADVPKLPSPITSGADDETVRHEVVNFYHQTLLSSPEALAYLDKRGVHDSELIAHFKLGFANRSLGLRLLPKRIKAGAQLREQLQRLGLFRETGREHLAGSLVIPLFTASGEIVQAYGRKILDNLREGTPDHLYLPQAHAGVFNVGYLESLATEKKLDEIILCEALIDALTFWVHGFKNVTSSFGVNGFTDELLQFFIDANIKRILIAYDRDEAGNVAAEKVAKQLNEHGIDAFRILFPKSMDANEYALKVTPAQQSLALVIRKAEWLGNGQAPTLTTVPIHDKKLSVVATSIHNENGLMPEAAASFSLAAEEKKVTTATTTNRVAIEPALPASVIPPAPVELIAPTVTEHEVSMQFDGRRYRVRGLQKNTSYELMKVNILFQWNEIIHVDTFDLYSAKQRSAFAKLAAIESGLDEKILQRDLGQVLLQLEGLQDQAIQAALAPKTEPAYAMTEPERESAFALLKDPELITRIVRDFALAGLVGEPSNALMGYIASVSRKLNNPLAIIVQSTSAAGKSALMEAVLKFMPDEERIQYSAMTGQSLFYLGETNLKHKVLAIAEEEGVRQAAYALKLLQSQGELTIASTGKDPHTGKLVTEEYRVEGPVMLFLTTTAIDIDEELLNRCVVLTINESREQTAAIQQRQRQARTLSGLLGNHKNDALLQQHRNAQRLLKSIAIVNPYAEQLRFVDSRTRTRRDHEKYLTLIDSIALLHQCQRAIKTIEHEGKTLEYIEVTPSDIALANRLAHDILGRSLDELPPPTRQLLSCVRQWVDSMVKVDGLRQNEIRFSRKELREVSGLSNTQLGVHLTRLVELEYLYAHAGKNGQRYDYELVFNGEVESDAPQLMGLIDVEMLQKNSEKNPEEKREAPESLRESVITTENLTDVHSNPTPSLRLASGALTGGLRLPENAFHPSAGAVLSAVEL